MTARRDVVFWHGTCTAVVREWRCIMHQEQCWCWGLGSCLGSPATLTGDGVDSSICVGAVFGSCSFSSSTCSSRTRTCLRSCCCHRSRPVLAVSRCWRSFLVYFHLEMFAVVFEFRISITGSVCFSETSPTCIFKGRQAERNFQHLRKRETRRKMTLQDPRNYVIPSISKDQINYLFLIISVKNQLKIAFKNL